jgi:hypothetical protein
MLRRQEEINNILDLYDYIDVLEMENERLKNAVPKIRSAEKSVSFIDKLMIEKGKEEIFKDVFINWNKVKCNYNEDTEKYEFTPFNKWLEHKLDMDDMPKTLSFEDFVCYFNHELQEKYTKEKEEALKEKKENK